MFRVFLLASLMTIGCGDEPEGDSSVDDTSDDASGDACDDPTPPADAPSADNIAETGAMVSCYYAPPEGYCVELNDPNKAAMAYSDGNGAIGCADAVVVTDAPCPTDTAIGRCTLPGTELRVYYPCNKYDELYDGPEASCDTMGGSYEAL
jgi:hypothetical protein